MHTTITSNVSFQAIDSIADFKTGISATIEIVGTTTIATTIGITTVVATATGDLRAPEAILAHEAHTIAGIAIHQINHHRRHHKKPLNQLMMVLQQHRIKTMQNQQQTILEFPINCIFI